MLERLQKILAQAGLGSRRQCEQFILQGRVTVDGKVVSELGAKADPEVNEIRVDGERVRPRRYVYFLLNKPRGYICTNADEYGRRRAIDLIPASQRYRLYTAGRLDAESQGLIIVTNDGGFANLITHPRYGIPKTYVVQVKGHLTESDIQRLHKGVWTADGKFAAQRVRIVERSSENTTLEVVLTEGRNREIRRMIARLGYKVKRLRRTRIGPITDENLPIGQHRRLSPEEVRTLREWAQRSETDRTTKSSSRPRRQNSRK